MNDRCAAGTGKFLEIMAKSLEYSLVAREDTAMAIHRAIGSRVAAMAGRIPLLGEVIFAGGCACNPCLKVLLGKALKVELRVPHAPELAGAIGAALIAEEGPSQQERFAFQHARSQNEKGEKCP